MTGAEDTAEFARRLRELKDRSGRSYGMLAKRLHMSTSTLHRYCNGDAVPAEYAPVERFARVCGASTEELVSLHRAWVLADAARRRPAPAPAPGSTAGGAAGAAGGAPGTRAAAEAASGSAPPGAVSATEADRADGTPAADAPAVSAAATGAPVAGTPTPNDAPTADTRALGAVTPDARTPDTPADAPGKGSTPAHSPATHQAGTAAAAAVPPKAGAGPEATGPKAEAGAGAGTGAGAGARPEADRSENGAGAAATPEPGTRTPHSPARRRLLVGSAVAAVAAVVLTGTLIARHGADDDHAPDRTAAAGAAASDKAPAPTPVSSEDPASPSPSVSASKAEEDEPQTPTPLPEASAAPRVTGTPLTVSTRPYVWEDPCSQHYLVNRPPAEMGPPPTEPDAPGWVAAMGAVSARDQMVALTFQAKGDRTVVLDAIHVRVLRSSAPLPWNDYAMGVGCGGNVTTKSFDVRLDDPRPAARPQGGQGAFPYKVSAAEPLVVYVTAHASAHDVSWALDLEWSSGGRSGTVRVDDHGRPFRTSGNTGRPRYEYPLGATAWNRPLA